MPNYTFENKETGDHQVVEMKMGELDEFKENHPELRQVLITPKIVDSVRIGVTKPPADFQKFVRDKVKAKTPGNSMGYSRWDTPKEI